MAFSLVLQIGQTSDCGKLRITDASNYSLNPYTTFANRKITITLSNATNLKVGSVTYLNYVWAYTSATDVLEIDISTLKDFALRLDAQTIELATTTFTTQEFVALTCLTMSAYLANVALLPLNKSMEKNPKIVKDIMRLLMETESANNAATEGNLSASQEALDRALNIYDNLKIGF